MTHHIYDLTIHDYKGIHELSFSKFGQINILTGSNNSGKTSILELIASTLAPQNLTSWLDGFHASARRLCSYFGFGNYYEALYHLFPCNQVQKQIEYEWKEESGIPHTVKMEAFQFHDQIPESELRKLNGFISNSPGTEEETWVEVQGLKLAIEVDKVRVAEKIIYDKQRRMPGEAHSTLAPRIIFVSPIDHGENITYLNNVLQIREFYSLLIQMLEYFDETITGINAIAADERMSLVNYFIHSTGHNSSLPLESYGDGMKKAVLLLCALIQAKDGILLIDEFEIGIHTSCMDKIFSLLLDCAVRLNVQIFMTTHSKEALGKVLHLSKELQEKITLYTLYRYQGENLVRALSCQKALKMKEQLGLELR